MKQSYIASFIVILFLLGLAEHAKAMSFATAQSIYTKILVANGIKFAPVLQNYKSNEVNADTNGVTIRIYSGMLRLVRNANEMALVLGHELGHTIHKNNFSEYQKFFDLTSINSEYVADMYGARYMQRAGYNKCDGAKLLLKFEDGGKTHPAGHLRYKRLGC